MKKLSVYFFIILIICNTAQALPKCEGEDDTKWTNCQGTYLKKDISKPGDEDKVTRDFIGEFGNIPGKRHGKGNSRIYKKVENIFRGTYKDPRNW